MQPLFCLLPQSAFADSPLWEGAYKASIYEGAVCRWHTIKAPTEPVGEKGGTR